MCRKRLVTTDLNEGVSTKDCELASNVGKEELRNESFDSEIIDNKASLGY